MADQWYYRLFGEEFGPVSHEALKSLVEMGTIGESDDVRQEGASDWITAAQVFAAERSAVGVAAPAATTEDDQWYCRLLGQELGPLSFEDLLKFAEVGELTAEDEVKLGAEGKWRKVGSIGRLVAVLPFQESQELRPAPIVDAKPSIPAASGSASPPPPLTTPAPSVSTATTPRYHPAAEEHTWYAWIQGTEYGPVSLLQLSQWLSTGQLGPADMVKQGMLSQWMPSAAVEQALARLTVTAAPVAAPVAATAAQSPPPASTPSLPPSSPRPPIPTPAAQAAPAQRIAPATPPVVAESKPTAESKPPAESKPSAATTSAAQAVIQRMAAVQAQNNAPASSESPARSTASGLGSAFGASSASASAWSTASTPAVKPPTKKAAPSRPPIDWGEKLAPLKNPKAIGAIAVVGVVVFLFFGSSLLPASTAGDRKKLEQLQQILAEFRQIRDEKGGQAEWDAFVKKVEEIRKPMADELERSANRRFPARQRLLWASRNRLPEMLQSDREKPGVAEEQFEANLYDAARLLGVAKGDPPKASEAANVETTSSEGDAVLNE